jgi:hypothetical protein
MAWGSSGGPTAVYKHKQINQPAAAIFLYINSEVGLRTVGCSRARSAAPLGCLWHRLGCLLRGTTRPRPRLATRSRAPTKRGPKESAQGRLAVSSEIPDFQILVVLLRTFRQPETPDGGGWVHGHSAASSLAPLVVQLHYWRVDRPRSPGRSGGPRSMHRL